MKTKEAISYSTEIKKMFKHYTDLSEAHDNLFNLYTDSIKKIIKFLDELKECDKEEIVKNIDLFKQTIVSIFNKNNISA